jgi:hypothetical protein
MIVFRLPMAMEDEWLPDLAAVSFISAITED